MQRGNSMFTKISADNSLHQTLLESYFYIIHCFKCRMDNADTVNGKPGLVENEDKSMNTCMEYGHFCLDNFYV